MADCRRSLPRFTVGWKNARRLNLNHAIGAQSISFARPFVASQDSRVASCDPDRTPFHQAADIYFVRQPDLSGARSLRLRSCLSILFQQARETAHSGRSRAARGSSQVALVLFANQSSRPCHQTPQPGDQLHAGGRENHSRPGHRCQEQTIGIEAATRFQLTGALFH